MPDEQAPSMPFEVPAWLRILLRVTGAVGGGYAVCAAWVALLSALLSRLGMQQGEAVVSAAMFGFLLYLVVLIWAFSVRSALTLWVGLAAAGGLAFGITVVLHG